jgi:protein-tyrosine phosphatase
VIDTHCHLLPGIDDGPRDDDETLALARQLEEDGVTRVVCTPHFSRQFPTSHELALERLTSTRALLAAAGIPLELDLAAEVSPAWAVSEPVEELRRRAIAGRFVLVELTPETPEPLPAAAAARLRDAGLGLVVAHPERSRAVQRRPGLVAEVRAAGAAVQVVASSLVGRWGGAVASTAWGLLEAGRADLIASDAHRARRESSLSEARALVRSRLGEEALHELTVRAPGALVAGRWTGARGESQLW